MVSHQLTVIKNEKQKNKNMLHKLHTVNRLGLGVDRSSNAKNLNDADKKDIIIIKQIIGPGDVFRNNKYTWNAVIEKNNKFFPKQNTLKLNWGYSIDNSNKINHISETNISNLFSINSNYHFLNPQSSLIWKVPNVKCNSIKVYAWIDKIETNINAVSNYLPLKDIYVKLLNFEVSPNIKRKLNNVDGNIQSISGNDNNQSKLFNMDYFSVRIDQMPFFDMNNDKNADILYNKIRANFLTLSKGSVSFSSTANKYKDIINVDGSWEFQFYKKEDNNDFTLEQKNIWLQQNSGTILFIKAGGGFLEEYIVGDDGAVLESESNAKERCWIFTTIVTGSSGTQPFSGHRQFGLHKDENGKFRFYARAIDRIWPSTVLLNTGNVFEPLVQDYLTIANATWSNLIVNVSKFIKEFGGETTIMKPEIILSDFKPFVENYKSKSSTKIIGNIDQFKKHEK